MDYEVWLKVEDVKFLNKKTISKIMEKENGRIL